MLVNLDYYFAQCEEVRNNSLKEKPVVVCVYSGRSEDSGVVSTANYIARKYGVRSGIPIAFAKRMLQNRGAVFLPVDHQFYDQISRRVMQILKEHSDKFERVSIDEMYLDVSQRSRGDFGVAGEIALNIKNEIREWEKLTCSIGTGPNKLVAKIAAEFKKPDGLTIVLPNQVENFLFPQPIDRLIGIGRKTAKLMNELGIETIGDLSRYDVEKLIEIFEQNTGTYFHNASMGIDYSPVQRRGELESISRIVTLKEDTHDQKTILYVIEQLCEEVNMKTLEFGLLYKFVRIVAIMKDLGVKNRSKTLEGPTDRLEVLKRTAMELFLKFLNESKLEIRRVGVEVSNFMKKGTQKRITSYG
ncbi:MAG: Y-family DNA polymerase [Thermoproteota archaeon]